MKSMNPDDLIQAMRVCKMSGIREVLIRWSKKNPSGYDLIWTFFEEAAKVDSKDPVRHLDTPQ